jgi:hypothetical protein
LAQDGKMDLRINMQNKESPIYQGKTVPQL